MQRNEVFDELLDRFFRVEGMLHRLAEYDAKRGGGYGNPMKGQGRVLALLKMKPQTTQKELGYLLAMRQQSLSELLAKLEKKGFITRKPSQEDKRVTMIALTESGATAAPDLESEERPNLFECLTTEERTQLSDYLDRIGKALEQKLGELYENEPQHGQPWNGGFDGYHGRPQFGHPPMPPFDHPPMHGCPGDDVGRPPMHGCPGHDEGRPPMHSCHGHCECRPPMHDRFTPMDVPDDQDRR